MYNQTQNTMAKIYGINGVITGKLGAAVYAVRNGEQISRQYQPVVANPSTPAQVRARAKLKLLSQMSAIMAPVIAIPRRGAVTSRNLFLKRNYAFATYTDNHADVTLQSVQLTESVIALGDFQTVRRDTNTIIANLNPSTVEGAIDRVVYALFAKMSDQSLEFAGSAVVSEPGSRNTWEANLPLRTEEVVIYAYGIRDNSEDARTRFGNLETATAESVAKLLVTSVLTSSDVTLTKTIGTTMAAASE